MNTCSTVPFSFEVQYFYNNDCFTCGEECGNDIKNAKCIVYTGANLACSGIETNDSLETALQKIDEQICSVTGDYSQYQYNCLTDWLGQSITTEAEFVSAITQYVCEITENLESFTGTTFPAYQSSVEAQFEAIEGPGITCTLAGVTPSDSLNTILTKYCTLFGTLNDALDISTVEWDSCGSITGTPGNLVEAFNVIVEQLCTIQAGEATLPTFNNSANCLNGTSEDSLVDTVEAIIEKVCATEPFASDEIALGCLTPDDTSLQAIVQELVDSSTTALQGLPTFSEDFVVTASDPENPCAGVNVSLATPINQDRFVAINVSDSSPGTLVDKLEAGDGIDFDIVTTPGKLIISSDGTADSYEVKANAGGTEGFLDNKLAGGSNTGISINVAYNGTSDKVDIIPTIDASALFSYLLDTLDSDSELYELFCAKVAACPSPCNAPTDVQIVPVTSTPTTTIGV